MAEEAPNLLTIPQEIRCIIYDNLVKFPGIFAVWSEYEMATGVDKQTNTLLHVCRTFRSEVQRFFYRHQCFEFRSVPAIKKFIEKIGKANAALITRIKLGEWLHGKPVSYLAGLQPYIDDDLVGLEEVKFTWPKDDWVKTAAWTDFGKMTPGDKLLTFFTSCKRFAGAKAYVLRESGPRLSPHLIISPRNTIPPENYEV